MLTDDSYDASNLELVAERKRARRLARRLNDTSETRIERREELIRELFRAAGESFETEPPFRCGYGYNVHVGEEFFTNFDYVFLDVCPTTIGNNCQLGPGIRAYTVTHPVDAAERTRGLESGEPMIIDDDMRLDGRAVVNPSATTGDDVVVVSGAVVTGDMPDDVVVGGNPACIVKELD